MTPRRSQISALSHRFAARENTRRKGDFLRFDTHQMFPNSNGAKEAGF
jgi:hypothetical protein